jgi:SpoVK/Ycf46/Vps4 family AAA+-type ATPase
MIHLWRIFDAAEGSSTILFFDEADALLGKRSEVQDSHDRYANVDVNYLLRALDAWQGLCIFAAGAKSNVDEEFLRRLRFVVKFPVPDADARTAIWSRAFPPLTPTDNLDFPKLATLEVTGGSIRNIALTATFLAAENEGRVGMDSVLTAASMEYLRLEKPFIL